MLREQTREEPKRQPKSVTSSQASTASPQSEVSARKSAPKKAPVVSPVDLELAATFSDEIGLAADSVQSRKMVLNMLHMLRRCNYGEELLVTVLAVALVHLDRVWERMEKSTKASGKVMEDTEKVLIAVMQCYLAHSYVIDETCPLWYWHANIYASFCSMRVLNVVAYKLLKIVKFNLSVTDADMAGKFKILGVEPPKSPVWAVALEEPEDEDLLVHVDAIAASAAAEPRSPRSFVDY